MNFIQDLQLRIQVAYDEFMWKYGEDRRQLARNRLKVHEKNMRGECPVNPYFDEDNDDWIKYID